MWSRNSTRFTSSRMAMPIPERTVEIVTLRVQAVARTRKPRQIAGNARCAAMAARRASARIASLKKDAGGAERSTIVRCLRPGDRFAGPAVIVELSATTYLPSGWTADGGRIRQSRA